MQTVLRPLKTSSADRPGRKLDGHPYHITRQYVTCWVRVIAGACCRMPVVGRSTKTRLVCQPSAKSGKKPIRGPRICLTSPNSGVS